VQNNQNSSQDVRSPDCRVLSLQCRSGYGVIGHSLLTLLDRTRGVIVSQRL
jgi:hypothetical protein